MSKKIVFYGGGNMAEGMMRGFIKNNAAAAEDITVGELRTERCEYLKQTYGVASAPDVSPAIKEADLVILAVNPPQIPLAAAAVKELLKADAVVMTIAAGVTLSVVEKNIGTDKKAVRIMPNTLSQAGNGYTALCPNPNCSDADIKWIETLLTALGQVMYLKEDMFNTFTAFSCTGPLWLYKTVEALTDAGVYIGFDRASARNIVIKNMMGVAGVLDITGEHPAVKVDQMTSPGGTTIEALKVLQDEGFAKAIMNSMAACMDKVNALE